MTAPNDDFTGDSKLARPWTVQVLNDFLHSLIALSAAYVLVLSIACLLAWRGHQLGWVLSILVGLLTGYSALFFRETLQFAKTHWKKLHWKDRLRDVLPGPFGAAGGALAWLTASRLFF